MRLFLFLLLALAVSTVQAQISPTAYNCASGPSSQCSTKAPFCVRIGGGSCVAQTCNQQSQLWCHSSTLIPFCRINSLGNCVDGGRNTSFPQSVQSGRITFGKGLYGATLAYSYAAGIQRPTGTCGVDWFCHGNSTCNAASTGCVCASPCWTGPLCNLPVARTPVPVAPGGVFYNWFDTVNRTINVDAFINATLALQPALRDQMYSVPNSNLRDYYYFMVGGAFPEGLRKAIQLSSPIPAPPRLATVCYEDMPAPLACTQCTNDTRCVRQTAPSNVLGVVVPASDVCCPRGFAGNDCNTPVGCSLSGCDNGGTCVRTNRNGTALRPADTFCENCPRGVAVFNGTGIEIKHGWNGKWCHVSNDDGRGPRVYASVAEGPMRRLLQTQISGAVTSGVPSQRACDCGVVWSTRSATRADLTGVYPLLTGNHPRNDLSRSLLSRVGYAPGNTFHRPLVFRPMGGDPGPEARYLCAQDAYCAGVVLFPTNNTAIFFTEINNGANPVSTLLPFLTVSVHQIDRTARRQSCSDATLNPVYYFDRWRPAIDANVIVGTSVGNIDIIDDPTLRATVHFRLFGHLEGMSPRSGCSMKVLLNQYVAYCNHTLPVESFVYTQPNIEDTCAPIDRVNSSRFEPFGTPLSPLQTGVVITTLKADDQPTCECRVPFTASQSNLTDCASAALCGANGRVNASWLAESEMTSVASVRSCICDEPFVTDPASCNSRECKWCANTQCLHGTSDVDGKGCLCPVIWEGPLCETLLCNATNTITVSTKYDGLTEKDIEFCECKPKHFGVYCEKTCVHGTYSNELGSCMCNDRSGHKGEFCDIPLCASGDGKVIRGVMEYSDRYLNDSRVSDENAGSCRCIPPYTGTDCSQDTCGFNAFSTRMPAGVAGVLNEKVQCLCEFPYASSSAAGLDCSSHSCGTFGKPDPLNTALTPAKDRCLCDAMYPSVGLYTDDSCTTTDCRPCSLGRCSVNATFGPHQVDVRPSTNQTLLALKGPEPCCLCNALAQGPEAGLTFNQTCTSFCAVYAECRTTARSGFEFDKAVNGYLCRCNRNFASSSNSTNLCDICAPNYSSTNTTIFPPPCDKYTPPAPPAPGNPFEQGMPPEQETSSTLVSGLSDPAFYALVSAAAVMALTGISALVGGSSAVAAVAGDAVPLVASKAASAKAPRIRGPSVGRRLLSVVAILSLLTLVQAADDGLWSASAFTAPTTIQLEQSKFFPSSSSGPTYSRISVDIPSSWMVMETNGKWRCFPVLAGRERLPGPSQSSNGFSRSIEQYNTDGGVYDETVPITTTEKEIRCGFNPASTETARIGTRRGILPSDVTWSTWNFKYDANIGAGVEDYSNYYDFYTFAINLCDQKSDCIGDKSQCVAYEGVQNNGQNFGFSMTEQTATFGYPRYETYRDVFEAAPKFLVRGCKCQPGSQGLRCGDPCDTTQVCSGRGTCPLGSSVTTKMIGTNPFSVVGAYEWMRTCACPVACSCNAGYSGYRCERAVQSNKLIAGTPLESTVQNYTKCCPYDSTDCDILTRTSVAPLTCTLTRSSGVCAYTGTLFDFYREHTSRPPVCGERTPPNNNNGTGQCFGNLLKDNRADCWCNTPDDPQSRLLRRRGYYGSNCEKKTCTRRTNVPFPRLASQRLLFGFPDPSIETIYSNGVPCSGNQNPTYKPEADFCDDLYKPGVASSINTEGVCRECANGFGAYRGLNPKSLVNTVYEKFLTGLCDQQTKHSNGGGICGGYGIATYGSDPAYVVANNGTEFTIPSVDSCQCIPPMVVPYANSGICQRTCSPGATGAFVSNVTTDGTGDGRLISIGGISLDGACSRKGLCYAAQKDLSDDGFNSACACNPGWNGFDCSIPDLNFFDQGFPRTGKTPDPLVLTPGGPTFCGSPGSNGIAILKDLGDTPSDPRLDAGRPQRDYFLRRILPMQGDALRSITDYTAFKCNCSSSSPPGWDTTNAKGVCARTCSALKGSNGLVCSGLGRGSCISDPFGQSMDKGCRCNLGWGGDTCSDPILRDGLNQTCGGNGAAVYSPGTERLRQQCLCFGGGDFEIRASICSRKCPQGRDPSTGTLQDCTSGTYGNCVVNATTGNDKYCQCLSGHSGPNCNVSSSAATQGVLSNVLYSCTYRGDIDPVSGTCKCLPGFVGPSCEFDTASSPCGNGQPYQDNEARGIVTVGSSQTSPNTTIVLSKTGQFDPARYLLVNPLVAAQGLDAWLSYSTDGFFRNVSAWLTNGYSGILNSTTVPASPPALLTLL